MRKFVAGLAAVGALTSAGAAIAGQAATSVNGEFVALNVAVTPPVSGTPRAPRGVGVSLDSFGGNRINGDAPNHRTSIVVRFNRGFKENGALFPACQINRAGASTCADSTRIGTGTGEAQIVHPSGAQPNFLPAELVAYNGKPSGGRGPTLIVIALLNGKPGAELDLTAAQQPRGPYGLALKQIRFRSLGTPVDISKLSLTIPDRATLRRVNGRPTRVHLFQAPTACAGAWQFSQTDTFSDAAPLTARDAQPCVKG